MPDYWVDCAHGDLEGLVALVDPTTSNKYFSININACLQVIQKVVRCMHKR